MKPNALGHRRLNGQWEEKMSNMHQEDMANIQPTDIADDLGDHWLSQLGHAPHDSHFWIAPSTFTRNKSSISHRMGQTVDFKTQMLPP